MASIYIFKMNYHILSFDLREPEHRFDHASVEIACINRGETATSCYFKWYTQFREYGSM